MVEVPAVSPHIDAVGVPHRGEGVELPLHDALRGREVRRVDDLKARQGSLRQWVGGWGADASRSPASSSIIQLPTFTATSSPVLLIMAYVRERRSPVQDLQQLILIFELLQGYCKRVKGAQKRG